MSEGPLDRIEQKLDALAGTVAIRFDGIDDRFKGIDVRFDEIDDRFKGIDVRFDEIDDRFKGIDVRLNGIDVRFKGIDDRFRSIDDRFNQLTILNEETRDRLKLVAEGVYATNERIDRLEHRVDERFDRVDRRLDHVEATMRTMFAQHDARIAALEGERTTEP
jgi:hypothetical protein